MSDKEKYYIGSPNATTTPKDLKQWLNEQIQKYGIPKQLYVDIPNDDSKDKVFSTFDSLR